MCCATVHVICFLVAHSTFNPQIRFCSVVVRINFNLLFYVAILSREEISVLFLCCVTDRKIRARRNSKALLAKHLMFPPNLKYLEFILESI